MILKFADGNTPLQRTIIYWSLGIGLIISYPVISDIVWRSSLDFHTIMELVATLLALFIGSMALVRYYSLVDPKFLIIGTGFIGTSLFDGFHTVITSSAFNHYIASDLSTLIPWSWIASRCFLASILLFSYIFLKDKSTAWIGSASFERKIYFITALSIISAFLFFLYVPLPTAYYQHLSLNRPEEIIPAIIFGLALWGYLKKGEWRYDSFDHWLIIALIVSFVSQVVFMPMSQQLFDSSFDIAHLLKIMSYACVLVGLFISMYQSFKDVEVIAHFDQITQLPNRILFRDRFAQAAAHCHRSELSLGVCFLDLDNFKSINDRHGHIVGDQLLAEAAKRITLAVREEDTVSRYGGDEFAILLVDIKSSQQCQQLLDRIHKSLQRPYQINKNTLRITASTGFTLYPTDNTDLDTLLRHADHAMYQAKNNGRNGYRMFNQIEDQNIIKRHLHMKEVQHALDNNEFVLYYQPKVDTVHGRVYGFEALIRWNHPQKGVLSPIEFLPLIADTELEIEVGNWVVSTAVKQLAQWVDQGLTCEVSVNISSNHLQKPMFLAHLDAVFRNYPQVESRYLQLEILESSALSDLKVIHAILFACHNVLGVQIALDDFGTGYSSLTHIRNLPVDIIKIDQEFVRTILDHPKDFAIIESMISLANAFSNDIIAEGVESIEHGNILQSMGCYKMQGYVISKPMPADEVPDWLARYQINPQWIDNADKSQSLHDKQTQFFRLTLNQWIDLFCNNIKSDPETTKQWPIMDRYQCHMGKWLNQSKYHVYFEPETIENLKHAHSIMHHIASEMYTHYQANNIELARDQLPKLKQIVAGIHNILKLA